MALRRTHSYLSVKDLPDQQTTTGSLYITASKELRSCVEKSIAHSLLPITNPAPLRRSRSHSQSNHHSHRATPSPTVQTPQYPSCTQPHSRQRRFPREPDLHKQAIHRCMLSSAEGQKILNMGPRLAVGIMSATRNLERILRDGSNRDNCPPDEDVVMDDWEVVNH